MLMIIVLNGDELSTILFQHLFSKIFITTFNLVLYHMLKPKQVSMPV